MGAHACRLVLTSGHLGGKTFDLPSEGVLRLGSAAGSHVHLPVPGVLPAHCFIKCQSGRHAIVIQDQGAELQINGTPTRRKLLEPGDAIRIGEASLLFEAAQTDPFVGATVGGYRIEELLGRGGMGTVYKATQLSLERLVAFKILSPELTRDKEFVREFLSEARAAAKLNHPNVVQIYDAGTVPLASLPPEGAAAYAAPAETAAEGAGRPTAAPEGEEQSLFFFSMEYLPGGTLAELLDREGKLSLAKVLEIGRDTARALVWAEEQGIVHRDIKPDNLLFAVDGAVKVADLGIAAEPGSSHRSSLPKKDDTAVKRPRAVGSPRYMAPEQAAGKPVDNRADIYALGSTLYRALSGKPPFEGRTASEILRAKLSADPPSIDTLVPDVPAPIVSLLNRMMAREPDGRPATCVEVLSDVEECLDSARGTPRSEPSGREKGPAPRGRRRRRRSGAARGAPLYVETLGGQVTLAISGLMILSSVVWAVVWKPREPSLRDPVVALEEIESGATDSEPDPAGDGNASGADEDREVVERGETKKPSGAEQAALRKLSAISKDWQAGIFDAKRTVERIGAFKREHPGAWFQEKADALIETIRQTRVQSGERALSLLIEKDVKPLVERGRFKDAAVKVESLAASYPELKEAVAEELRKIEDAARIVWSQADGEADKLIQAGDHQGAVERMRAAVAELPPGVAKTASEKIAAVERSGKDYGDLLKNFGQLATRVEEAALALDYERAVSVASGIPEVLHPVLAWRRTMLIEETRRARDAWEALKAGVAKRVASGTGADIAFEPGGAAAALKFKSLDGCVLVVERPGAKAEGRDLFAARTRDLIALVSEGAGANAAAPPGRVLEGLGLLLLLRQGPERGKEVLLDPRLGSEKLEAYKLRLKEDEGPFLARAPRAAQARVGELRAKPPSPAVAAGWEALASGLAATIHSARKLPGYATVREGLAAAFVAARIEALKSAGPHGLFAGKVESYQADGTIGLLYDFNSENELKDFIAVKGTSSEREFTEGKSVKFLGEFRFLKGDVFRNQLSVAVKVPNGGYTPQAPNINVALWTRDGDRLSPATSADAGKAAPAQPEDEEQLEGLPDDYFVFALGYKASVYNRRMRGYEYLSPRGAQNSVLMPANAVLGGLRGARLHSVAEDDCIWAKDIKNVKGPQFFKVAMSGKPGELPVFTIGGRAAPLKESKGLDLLQKRTDPYVGSLTVLTNGEVVEYDSIAIEGQLNSAWLDAQFRGVAEKELKKIDPGNAPAALAPVETTGGDAGEGPENGGARADAGKKKAAPPRPAEPLPEPGADE